MASFKSTWMFAASMLLTACSEQNDPQILQTPIEKVTDDQGHVFYTATCSSFPQTNEHGILKQISAGFFDYEDTVSTGHKDTLMVKIDRTIELSYLDGDGEFTGPITIPASLTKTWQAKDTNPGFNYEWANDYIVGICEKGDFNEEELEGNFDLVSQTPSMRNPAAPIMKAPKLKVDS